jgi:hypothetical protein
MKKLFYEIAAELDQYKNIENPDENQVQSLISYVGDTSYSKYFFDGLENPNWVTPLFKKGVFTKVPPPLEDTNSPGYFSMPIWYAGEYLKRMANKFPNIVKEVAISLETDNSRGIRTILEALLNIPVNFTAETVGKFKDWVKTPFSNFMMISHELGLIMEYLAKGDEIQAALETLSVLLEPVQTQDRYEKEKKVASARHDYHWLSQALQLNLPILTKKASVEVVKVAEDQLIKAINLEHDPRYEENTKILTSYWRLNISPKSDTNYNNEIKNLIVDTLISGLNEGCEQKKEEIPQLLSRFIDSNYSIFKRISLYILQIWGAQYPELLEKSYYRYVENPIHGIQIEFDSFTELQFANFTQAIKEEILVNRKNPDEQFVEEILNNRPDSFAGNTRDEKRISIIETWQTRELTPLAQHLEGAEKEHYDNLVKKYGKPTLTTDDGDDDATLSWIGEKSPIESDEFSKKSIAEVVQYLIGYIPENNYSFEAPSIEGLANLLEDDVQARTKDYTSQANLFINSNLRFVYHVHLLRGLENIIKKNERISLEGIISVCQFIVDQKEEYQKSRLEEGLSSAKLAVAHLLEELFRAKEPYIEGNIIEKCGAILETLLIQKELFPDNEDAQGYDPATHSLNCVHGVAMHALISYGLYCERKRKQEMKNDGLPVMIPLLRRILSERLDKRRNQSLAVHSIYGWYFPQFIYLDKKWALENIKKIFPNSQKKNKYWHASWDAYIRFSDVYKNVFPELVKQYKKALLELNRNEKNQQGLMRSDEKLATHILKAYLLDMINLESRDKLISIYYQHANDEMRAQGIFWLSKVLESQQPSENDVIWQKIWILWQMRIEEASNSQNKDNYVKEISNFSRLLKNTPIDLEKINFVLEQTLKFKSDGFEAQEIIEFLGKQSESFSNLAVSHLQSIVLAYPQLYLLEDARKSVEHILSSAMVTDDSSKAKAIEIINIFGERGDYSWRSMLSLSK